MTATLAIRQDIGSWGISADEFIGKLDALGAVDEILLFVNSDGGSVFDASAIYQKLASHPARVTAEVEGIAASAASYLIMAADEIRVHESSFIMVHNAQSGVLGNKRDMTQMAGVLDQLDQSIASIYAARAGGDRKDWLSLMDRETWLSGPEFADLGLATLIPNKGPDTASTTTAKARYAIDRRPAATSCIIDRLRNSRRPAVPGHVRQHLERLNRRMAEIRDHERLANQRKILDNARTADQARRYASWS